MLVYHNAYSFCDANWGVYYHMIINISLFRYLCYLHRICPPNCAYEIYETINNILFLKVQLFPGKCSLKVDKSVQVKSALFVAFLPALYTIQSLIVMLKWWNYAVITLHLVTVESSDEAEWITNMMVTFMWVFGTYNHPDSYDYKIAETRVSHQESSSKDDLFWIHVY